MCIVCEVSRMTKSVDILACSQVYSVPARSGVCLCLHIIELCRDGGDVLKHIGACPLYRSF
jgi:hypothetical protein